MKIDQFILDTLPLELQNQYRVVEPHWDKVWIHMPLGLFFKIENAYCAASGSYSHITFNLTTWSEGYGFTSSRTVVVQTMKFILDSAISQLSNFCNTLATQTRDIAILQGQMNQLQVVVQQLMNMNGMYNNIVAQNNSNPTYNQYNQYNATTPFFSTNIPGYSDFSFFTDSRVAVPYELEALDKKIKEIAFQKELKQVKEVLLSMNQGTIKTKEDLTQ